MHAQTNKKNWKQENPKTLQPPQTEKVKNKATRTISGMESVV